MSLVVRIFAPTGRDAQLLLAVLQGNGIEARICSSHTDFLRDAAGGPLGPLLIAEEALSAELTLLLRNHIASQPSWSDIPILIVTRGSGERGRAGKAEQVLSFGLPVYLERPLRPETLVSNVRAALRARKRQYEARDALIERDHALAELEQERAALIRSEKLAAVGRLAASISHEINNPLESVTNLIYLAFHTPGLPAETCNLLASADEELRRVSQIVAHTLRFHRQSTNASLLTARELLEPTLGIYRGRLANAHIEVSVEYGEETEVLCLEGDVRQVLNNLIGNAIDAMRSGGKLRVRARKSRQWRPGVPPDQVETLRITIADTGSGISPESRRHLFEAFFTTKGIHGTGLGLWISQGIVTKHGGLLQVCSKSAGDKTGTVFSLSLPLRPAFE